MKMNNVCKIHVSGWASVLLNCSYYVFYAFGMVGMLESFLGLRRVEEKGIYFLLAFHVRLVT